MASDLGTLLYDFIAARGLTAEEFAEKAGVAKGTISKLKTKPPSPRTLTKIDEWAVILGLPAAQRQELREAAHLARATPEVRALVARLRVQLSQLRDHVTDLDDLARSKGIKLS